MGNNTLKSVNVEFSKIATLYSHRFNRELRDIKRISRVLKQNYFIFVAVRSFFFYENKNISFQ